MAVSPEQTVRPDSKGRVALGAYAKGVSSYRIRQENDGRLILEPYTEIPAREAWLYKNKKALESVRQGLRDVKAGKVHDLGDFTKYIDE